MSEKNIIYWSVVCGAGAAAAHYVGAAWGAVWVADLILLLGMSHEGCGRQRCRSGPTPCLERPAKPTEFGAAAFARMHVLGGKTLGRQPPNPPLDIRPREGCVRQGASPAPLLACNDSPKQDSC